MEPSQPINQSKLFNPSTPSSLEAAPSLPMEVDISETHDKRKVETLSLFSPFSSKLTEFRVESPKDPRKGIVEDSFLPTPTIEHYSCVWYTWPEPPSIQECEQAPYLGWQEESTVSESCKLSIQKFREAIAQFMPSCFEKFDQERFEALTPEYKAKLELEGKKVARIKATYVLKDAAIERYLSSVYPEISKCNFWMDFNFLSIPSSEIAGSFNSHMLQYSVGLEANITIRSFGFVQTRVLYQKQGIAKTAFLAYHEALSKLNIPISFLSVDSKEPTTGKLYRNECKYNLTKESERDIIKTFRSAWDTVWRRLPQPAKHEVLNLYYAQENAQKPIETGVITTKHVEKIEDNNFFIEVYFKNSAVSKLTDAQEKNEEETIKTLLPDEQEKWRKEIDLLGSLGVYMYHWIDPKYKDIAIDSDRKFLDTWVFNAYQQSLQ